MSKTEGQSIATLEAMACGLPVIVTPVGAIPDVIKDGINGFLVKSNQPKILAQKIISLLNDDALREKIGNAARKTIEERHANDMYVNQLVEVFNKVMLNSEKNPRP